MGQRPPLGLAGNPAAKPAKCPFFRKTIQVTAINVFSELNTAEQIASLADCLSEILAQYGLGDYRAESINHEFNSTFAVTSESGERFALRINVNSTRSLEDLNAEIFWVNSITAVKTPKPVANLAGESVTLGWHEASARTLNAVLYSWLEGAEPGDDPSEEQLRAAGAAMAALHGSSAGLEFPAGAELPGFSDFFWGERDFLLALDSELDPEARRQIVAAREKIELALGELTATATVQPIHADLHPWNMMWHEGTLAVFDFDDCGWGLPVQDLATALYYLDTAEQERAFLAGYASVRELPSYTPEQLALLLLHRRILLFNYLYETTHPEHRAEIPAYQAETVRRIETTLGKAATAGFAQSTPEIEH